MARSEDPFRPRWSVASPWGQSLTVEFDRLRGLWRVTPGEYVRRQLVDALAQATGQPRDAPWTVKLADEITAQLRTR